MGVDEYFQRTDSAGSHNFISDPLGTTLALTDANGNLATNYTYDPFGNVSSSDAPNTNSFQFTGRENDNGGLYFYRARYYKPSFQRFASQDPIDFARGDTNLYGYVSNDPMLFRDPTGLWQWYGCWGGPNWSGCQTKSLENLTPEEWSKLVPPIDQQDECYYKHDFCYSYCRVNNKTCVQSRRTCGNDCDKELAQCLGSLNGLGGANNPSAWGAEALFSLHHPDPGQ